MPLQLSPLPADRFEEWRDAARQRVIDGNRASGHRVGADAVDFADAYFEELLPDGLATPSARILRIVDEEQPAPFEESAHTPLDEQTPLDEHTPLDERAGDIRIESAEETRARLEREADDKN